jgi:hypothetical protein
MEKFTMIHNVLKKDIVPQLTKDEIEKFRLNVGFRSFDPSDTMDVFLHIMNQHTVDPLEHISSQLIKIKKPKLANTLKRKCNYKQPSFRNKMEKKNFDVIIAMDENYGIGYKTDIPWNIPFDNSRFNAILQAEPYESLNCIIIGRKTWYQNFIFHLI